VDAGALIANQAVELSKACNTPGSQRSKRPAELNRSGGDFEVSVFRLADARCGWQ